MSNPGLPLAALSLACYGVLKISLGPDRSFSLEVSISNNHSCDSLVSMCIKRAFQTAVLVFQNFRRILADG